MVSGLRQFGLAARGCEFYSLMSKSQQFLQLNLVGRDAGVSEKTSPWVVCEVLLYSNRLVDFVVL